MCRIDSQIMSTQLSFRQESSRVSRLCEVTVKAHAVKKGMSITDKSLKSDFKVCR